MRLGFARPIASRLPLLLKRTHSNDRIALKNLKDFIHKKDAQAIEAAPIPPYLEQAFAQDSRPAKRVFIETYGCQMNFSDTEIVIGVLQKSGRYTISKDVEEADVVLLMTCAIRENAEAKIWSRLDALGGIEKRKRGGLTVGVLGCMAERLKSELLEKRRNVDLVCGPDAYRDLPRLLEGAFDGVSGINVMLSADETYADIAPVRTDSSKKSAFVSIMRGCNNMCAFCIVPFTRSRPIESIVEEVQRLSDEGLKEVTLLGQNVNSYCDLSIMESTPSVAVEMSRGFRTVYKPTIGGKRFVDLLERVSSIDKNMRIRFTSPHPKDFPDDLLFLMRDRPNICKQIHLPAQSGSTAVLERMRRGYTREAYIELVEHIREIIPNVSLSSDFIAGFCGETEADHQDTLGLLETVGYDMAYMFAYSMREKTMAHRRFEDDVPEADKKRRLAEIIAKFYEIMGSRVEKSVGRHELVLVEGDSKKSNLDLAGRSDGGRNVVFPRQATLDLMSNTMRFPVVGDYVHLINELSSCPTEAFGVFRVDRPATRQ
ncbi:putative cdk5 activator-binding protein [Paramicrosporidium saccamoebae]|uniref:Putative cdk5 activator-binding protein n=1 Tax=Paramicrosporidium saccamoebae TaxID=1246581 RepID=A0A2H9TLX2_9FUNG|nr:putative cdk5 activator-binding protein [Paramicrosporidium saccamoebae]